MLKQIDITQFTMSEKLSNNDNSESVFSLPHITFLSHSTSTDNNNIVIKEFPSVSLLQFSNVARIVESINLISHPCIANVLGFFQGSGKIPPSLIYTYYPLRSVNDLIKSFKSGNMDNKYQLFNATHFMKICYGVAYAMNLMHSHQPQFFHRDLRAGTILLNENFEPFVSGYGLSEVNSNKKYVAPEIIGNSNSITDPRSLPPIDVYAYGVFIKKLLKVFMISSNYKKDDNQELINCFKSLIKICKASNPLNRPKFSDILLTFDNSELKYSLKQNQNNNFDEDDYTSYCKRLIDTKPGNNANNQKCKSDIDSVFGQIMLQRQDNSQISDGQLPLNKINENFPSRLSQPAIYPAKIASQMIAIQQKGRKSMLNQSSVNQSSNTNQRIYQYQPHQPHQPLPPLPPQPNQNNNKTQFPKLMNNLYLKRTTTDQPSSQLAFSKHLHNSSFNRANPTLSNKSYSEINSSREEFKKSLLPTSSRHSERFIDQTNGAASSSLSSETENCNTDKKKNPESDNFNEADSLNSHSTKTFQQNNNKFNGHLNSNLKSLSKTLNNGGNTGSKLLGTSLLHPVARCTDDIFEDAMHNDKGDTVYLNIVHSTKLFKEAADRGHIDSMFRLAVKLYDGIGVKPDVYDSMRYFKKSWEVGMKSESAARLAEIYLTNKKLKNVEEGERYLDEALRANDLYANYLVVKLFVEKNDHNYLYCTNKSGKSDADILESAAREASISLRFCLRREYKLQSPVFTEFAKLAPKSFIESIEKDAEKDPSAMFYIGVLCHQSILNSAPKRAISLLELSFSKNYRSAFDYFLINNLKPFSSSIPKGCGNIIKGSILAKSGKENEAIGLLKTGSESCNWAPDYDTIHKLVCAIDKGTVDAEPVLELLNFYADNGSGPAKEELGLILIQGIKTEKNASKGLYYLKSAFDDPNYKMKNLQLLRDNCPGFYFEYT